MIETQSQDPQDSRWRTALAHPFFRGVREERVAPILTIALPQVVPARTLINLPGSSEPALHLVLFGLLRSYLLNYEGRELLLEIIGPGGLDGFLTAAGLPGHFTEAVHDSLVASFSRDTLNRLIEADARIEFNLLSVVAARLAARERHLEAMAARGSTRGLASLLLLLAEKAGAADRCETVLDLRLTHQMLADMLGVRRETVTVDLPELVAAGAVRTSKRRFVVDPAALRQFVES